MHPTALLFCIAGLMLLVGSIITIVAAKHAPVAVEDERGFREIGGNSRPAAEPTHVGMPVFH